MVVRHYRCHRSAHRFSESCRVFQGYAAEGCRTGGGSQRGGQFAPPLASNSTLLAGGNLEKKSGRKVVTKDNFLGLTQSAKKAVNLKGK